MYKKSPQGWLKHWDFILLDIFCLQLAFVVAYLVRQGLENPYSDQIYRTVAFVFMLCQIVVMFLGQSYQDILKRGYYIEFTKTAKHVLMVMLLSVLYLFATQQAVSYSSGKNFIEKIGGYSVITSSINTASPKQLLYKRLMDIAGGIVGCLLTVILIIVIGPMIYVAFVIGFYYYQ